MKKWVFRFFLIGVLVVAFILRFYKVTEIPPSLNWDEVSIGYNAYSVLKTGKDEWGKFLPIHFKSYGEYKLPAQIYASIPGIAIFGLNELGVRITPVIYGTLTVLLLYFLAKELFKNEPIAVLSAFLLAVSPWHIHLTRASFESSFSVLWVVLGIWLMVKGFKNKKWWPVSMIPFAQAMYTYNSARVFVPLFLFTSFILFWRQATKNKVLIIVSAVIFIIFNIPIIAFVLKGEGIARYKLVSISDDPGLIPRISENRNLSKLPAPFARLVHNRVTYISFYFARNYFSHFTPSFLFINGAPHKQHHVQGIGELYPFQAPFVILGIYFLVKKKANIRVIFSWLLISFVPVSVTNDSIPHALRTLIAAPAYQIISAYGIYEAYLILNKKGAILENIFWGIISVFAFFNFYTYLNNYYNIYPKSYSRDWQYGYKEVVSFIGKFYKDYDLIVFSRHYGEPHMFTLFFLKWDPYKFQNDPNLVRFETYDWIRVLRFDKFYFPDLGDPGTKFSDIVKENPGKKILFIGKSGDFPKDARSLLTVDFLNGDKAFEIVEVK